MFKLAIYLDNNNNTVDPFACAHLSSYLRNGIIVMTQTMLELTNDLKAMSVPIQTLLIIGDGSVQSKHPGRTFSTMAKCMSYLHSEHPNMIWWLIGDNDMANQLIWNGVVMDVHLSKSYAPRHSSEYKYTSKHVLSQSNKFNKLLLKSVPMRFRLMSATLDMQSDTRSHRHYFRRNEEETALISSMKEIITYGFRNGNRTGVDTRAVFGKHFEYRLIERVDPLTNKSYYQLPLLTTKKMFIRGVFEELKWFLNGKTNSKMLEAKGVNIWKGNTTREFLDSRNLNYEEGEAGPIYGFQMRHSGATWDASKTDYSNEGVDQVANVIKSLQEDPFSRRHIIDLWAPNQLDQMCLPPCHLLYQFVVHENDNQKYLSLMMTQRSADVFHGVPFNIASCSILLMMMAHRVGMKPYKFVHSVGHCHIYETHLDAVTSQLSRDPFMFPYASITCDGSTDLEAYQLSDIDIQDYHCHPTIKADMVA